MPSKSKAQARLMAAAAHNPKIDKKAGIPMSVAKEFNEADQAAGNLKKSSKLSDHVKSAMRKHGQMIE